MNALLHRSGLLAALSVLMAVLVLQGCGTPDPCQSVDGACLSVRVEADAGQTADRLLLQITLGTAPPVMRSTTPMDGQPTGFPLLFALTLGPSSGLVALSVTAQLGGTNILSGMAQTAVDPGTHQGLTVSLGPFQPPPPDMAAPAPDLAPPPDMAGPPDLPPPQDMPPFKG